MKKQRFGLTLKNVKWQSFTQQFCTELSPKWKLDFFLESLYLFSNYKFSTSMKLFGMKNWESDEFFSMKWINIILSKIPRKNLKFWSAVRLKFSQTIWMISRNIRVPPWNNKNPGLVFTKCGRNQSKKCPIICHLNRVHTSLPISNLFSVN